MSIETELIAAKCYLEDCYNAVEDLQGVIPQNKCLNNLSATVSTIPSTPVIETGIATYIIDQNNAIVPVSSTSYMVPDNYFSNITEIDDYALYFFAYTNTTYNKNVNIFNKIDLKNLTNIGEFGCYHAFYKCSNITSIDLSSLISVSDNACFGMFTDCTSITSVDLSKLKNLSASSCTAMFYGCTGITSVDLSGLQNADSDSALSLMFYRCTNLTSVNLNNLTTIGNQQQTFRNCTSLQTISFPSLTTATSTYALNGCFQECNNLLEIHFRTDAQTVIEGLNDYLNKFGATNATIYFDL